jgi:multiple sugar transport system substrate-binding protein
MPPKNIFESTNSFQVPPAPQMPAQNPIGSSPQQLVNQPTNVQAPVKKKYAKSIFLVVIILMALILLAGLAYRLLGHRGSRTGQITWWGLWENQSVVQPLISEYESSHPGVKITYVAQSQQDYRERLTNALAKGDGPDIFSFHNSWVPMFRNDLDSLPATVMNPADFAKTFYPVASSDLTLGNSIVGIPLEYDALTLFVNTDILNAAGLKPPTDWNQLTSPAYLALTKKDDQGVITQSEIALGRTENVDHWPEILALMMIQNGVDLSNPTGPAAEGALTFFTNFSTVYDEWDATLPSSTQAFASGKLAMYFGPSWRAFEIEQQNPNLKFETVPVPQLPKDNPNEPDITYATYWAQGVWSKSPNKAIAWDFLKFLSTQDSLQKLYKNESATRSFGEPYPRTDMATLLSDQPVLGSIVSQAPGARSWYLDSRTFDGPTGINSQLINYFGDAVNAVADRKDSAASALATCAQGVRQVLAQYGLSAK